MNAKTSPTSKTYVAIFGWLAFLTLLEIGAASLGLPRPPLAIFLVATAIGKATLIALYFMHLRFEHRFVWFLPAIPVLVALVFIFALFPDLVFHLTHRIRM